LEESRDLREEGVGLKNLLMIGLRLGKSSEIKLIYSY
jgi:hypothetical protein